MELELGELCYCSVLADRKADIKRGTMTVILIQGLGTYKGQFIAQ